MKKYSLTLFLASMIGVLLGFVIWLMTIIHEAGMVQLHIYN